MEGTSARNPGDDVTSWQQNPTEPGPRVSRLHSGEEPAASSRALKMFCCLPLPRGRRPGRAQQQNVWHRARQWLRNPPRGLWPFSRRNGKVTREPQAGPCPLSHPTRGTLSPFPVCVDEGFSGYVCLKQAPADVGQKSVGWVAGCVHTPGESRVGAMGRVQAAPAAQEDPTCSGGGGCGGGGGGGGLGREGSPRSRVGTRADTCFCRQQNFKWAEAAAVLVRPSSVKSKQGWLTVSVISERASGCGR